MSYHQLRIEHHSAATIVTLARPERRNALSLALITELHDALRLARRTVILAGDGPAFCAGHDLRELEACDADSATPVFEACSALMLEIRSLPVAVIAEVHGVATAAGCQLVAACDLAVASDHSTFATPGVRIGLFCTTPAVAVVRAVGSRRAMEMLLTGSPITAQTALDWGLVHRVVPATELRRTTLEIAEQIGQGSPDALAIGKRAVYAHAELPEPQAYTEASRVMANATLRPDAREGISAFLARRAPVWPSAPED